MRMCAQPLIVLLLRNALRVPRRYRTLRPIRMNSRSVLRLCERQFASVFGLSKPKMDAATLSGTSNSSSGRTRSSRVLNVCSSGYPNARSIRYANGSALDWVCCRQSAERTGQDFETCSPPFGDWLQRSLLNLSMSLLCSSRCAQREHFF